MYAIFVRGTYVKEADDHGKSDNPAGFLLEEPSELVDASVEVGVAGDAISAGCRQGLLPKEVVVCTVCSAATNLQYKNNSINYKTMKMKRLFHFARRLR